MKCFVPTQVHFRLEFPTDGISSLSSPSAFPYKELCPLPQHCPHPQPLPRCVALWSCPFLGVFSGSFRPLPAIRPCQHLDPGSSPGLFPVSAHLRLHCFSKTSYCLLAPGPMAQCFCSVLPNGGPIRSDLFCFTKPVGLYLYAWGSFYSVVVLTDAHC